MVEGDDSFKRPGAVPFNWEIRPGISKTRILPPVDPTLLQPPKKLPPLRLNQLPPPSSPSSSSDSKTRPVSPFDPPPSFKLKPPPDPDSHSSGPPAPYFRSLSPGPAPSRRWRFVKSLFGMKKSKSGDLKTIGEESTSSRSDGFYESETTMTFSPSEGSSRGSVSTRWSSPKSSLSSFGGSPLKRIQSDLSSSYENKTILMMARDRFG